MVSGLSDSTESKAESKIPTTSVRSTPTYYNSAREDRAYSACLLNDALKNIAVSFSADNGRLK